MNFRHAYGHHHNNTMHFMLLLVEHCCDFSIANRCALKFWSDERDGKQNCFLVLKCKLCHPQNTTHNMEFTECDVWVCLSKNGKSNNFLPSDIFLFFGVFIYDTSFSHSFALFHSLHIWFIAKRFIHTHIIYWIVYMCRLVFVHIAVGYRL